MPQSKPRDLTPEELALAETSRIGLFGAETVPQSKPRDLSSEELALSQEAPPSAGATEPLRIPPGTQVAIEQLNPTAALGATGSPKAGPTVTDVTAVVPGSKTPVGKTDSAKRKGK